MESASPQSWIQQTSVAVIQGDNPQWGIGLHGKYGDTQLRGSQATPYIMGKMATGPVSTQTEQCLGVEINTLLTSTDLSLLRRFSLVDLYE